MSDLEKQLIGKPTKISVQKKMFETTEAPI